MNKLFVAIFAITISAPAFAAHKMLVCGPPPVDRYPDAPGLRVISKPVDYAELCKQPGYKCVKAKKNPSYPLGMNIDNCFVITALHGQLPIEERIEQPSPPEAPNSRLPQLVPLPNH